MQAVAEKNIYVKEAGAFRPASARDIRRGNEFFKKLPAFGLDSESYCRLRGKETLYARENGGFRRASISDVRRNNAFVYRHDPVMPGMSKVDRREFLEKRHLFEVLEENRKRIEVGGTDFPVYVISRIAPLVEGLNFGEERKKQAKEYSGGEASIATKVMRTLRKRTMASVNASSDTGPEKFNWGIFDTTLDWSLKNSGSSR